MQGRCRCAGRERRRGGEGEEWDWWVGFSSIRFSRERGGGGEGGFSFFLTFVSVRCVLFRFRSGHFIPCDRMNEIGERGGEKKTKKNGKRGE